jgi:hypothetical protein
MAAYFVMLRTEEKMKNYYICMIILMMVLGFIGMSSAAIVTDPTGDAIGPTDIRAVRAEQMTRGDGVVLLKVSLTATPNIGGIMVFEADVDSSTGTGGNLSMTGIPVPPCPCKTTAGIDVVIMMMNRKQGANSNVAMCTGCSDSAAASCGKARYRGEWFATVGGTDRTGVLRGYADPLPNIGTTSKCYTFPWADILFYVRQSVSGPDIFDYNDALDPATTKWQLSVWTDPAYGPWNEDDFADGTTYFNISDVVPNGNGNLVNGVDVADNLTFCEGNFDGDQDQDGPDFSRFYSDVCRNPFTNPCPKCGPHY